MIPNGIDPDDLQPQDPDELTRLRSEFAAPDEKLVLLIGRLVYEKGFQLALEAMPRLIEEAPGHPLPRRRLRHPRGTSCTARPRSWG